MLKIQYWGIAGLLMMMSLSAHSALSDNESDYYTENIGNGYEVITDLTGRNNADDSNRLNDAITDMSNDGGGVIRINKVANMPYIYLRDVKLKDKVHVKISPNVIIKPYYGGNRPKNIVVFDLGQKDNIKNVALTSVHENSTSRSDWFTVILPGGPTERVRFVNTISALNFKISGIKFIDSYTIYANLEFNLSANQSRDWGNLPTKGLVKNVYSKITMLVTALYKYALVNISYSKTSTVKVAYHCALKAVFYRQYKLPKQQLIRLLVEILR